MLRSRILKTALFCFFILLVVATNYAYEDDGFGQFKKIESQHFIIYYAPLLNPDMLTQQLNIGVGEVIISEQPLVRGNDLGAMLDTLFSWVGKQLDMNLYSLQGNIKICKDDVQLKQVYNTIFGRNLKVQSFYISEYKTIYISAEHFKKEILAHEIAHMIISHYFVVAPPQRAAEILAGYVEYQLRKSN
jgi:hypothetical protein